MGVENEKVGNGRDVGNAESNEKVGNGRDVDSAESTVEISTIAVDVISGMM